MINWDLYKGSKVKRSKEAYRNFCKKINKINYKLVSEYKNPLTKVKLICDKGHEIEVKPNSIKRGNRCQLCTGNKNINTSEQAKKDFFELLDNINYKLVGEYKNNKTKAKLICNHNHSIEMTPHSIKRGYRCPMCSKNNTEQAKKDFFELLDNINYKLVGEYKGSLTKVKLICDKGHEIEMIPNNIKNNGQRCSRCNTISYGEILTKKILDEYGCKYESQKKFDGLTGLGGRKLSYDFFVDNYLLIEIQGEQHYKPIKHFGGEERFKQQQEHDRLKREFAKNSGYELLEIPYFGVKDLDKLEKILREKLSKKYLIAS
ncbi:hypothetical protein [Clostridium perfringens]|uniref:hypothetical protein n=1 Tax=Clostridium perfringens TaxID=1502 RepID=UPI001E342E25|nr:hypothetical protein [Clostridium perfringens]WVL78331.1 hypothetical protein LMS42_015315 [Clostridium perfringens]